MRNVPDEIVERLAAQAGTSVSALAVRELAQAFLRADNPALVDRLPDLGVEPAAIVGAVEAGRSEPEAALLPGPLPFRDGAVPPYGLSRRGAQPFLQCHR